LIQTGLSIKEELWNLKIESEIMKIELDNRIISLVERSNDLRLSLDKLPPFYECS
jgi:hypothetical protein